MERISEMAAAHALLGASSSHRWLHCTPSAVAEHRLGDTAGSSSFAEEGTLAHALCARRLKIALGQSHEDEDSEIESLKDLYLCGEMEEHVDGYVNFVLNRYQQALDHARKAGKAEPELRIEQHLDFSDYVPDGFGTGDAVIAGGEYLEIIDLKYGKGVEVSAVDNSQMKLYALGAIGMFDYLYDVESIRMTIYQPRLGNESSWITTLPALIDWAENEVRPLAQVAYRGLGARMSGDWCKFCKVEGTCPRLAADSLSAWEFNPDADALTPEETGRLLPKVKLISEWVSEVEQVALDRAMAGESIPGYKIVEGRSIRKITDPGKLASLLRDKGASDEDIYRPLELRTLTELEKSFGKKFFAGLLGDCIDKPAGKPALVPQSDKRPAMNAMNDFNGMV